MAKKLKDCLSLFFTFMLIGVFTFGGGYSMIPLISEQVVEKKKWIRESELMDILIVAESTPGAIAVNIATFVGHRVSGILGSIFATLGLIIPSFVIILLVSLIYDKLLQFEVFQNAFKGLKVGVTLLLIIAIIKLGKNIKKDLIFWISFSIALIISLIFGIWFTSFTYISIILIAVGLIFGIILTRIKGVKKK